MKYLTLLFTLSTFITFSYGQSYQIATEAPTTVTIKGSSTLHDWSVKSGDISGYPTTLNLELENGSKVKKFDFKVKVASMDGGRGPTMNNKIKTALKATTNPYVKFSQSSPSKLVEKEGKYYLLSKGIVEIAGVKKNITVKVNVSKSGNTLTLSGSKALKMSDFKITPPSAMFGQIQTKDDIIIEFAFKYIEK